MSILPVADNDGGDFVMFSIFDFGNVGVESLHVGAHIEADGVVASECLEACSKQLYLDVCSQAILVIDVAQELRGRH